MTEQNELVKVDVNEFLAILEPIKEDVVQEVVGDARNQVTWVKITAGGLFFNDDTHPRVQGVITYMHPHYIRWEDEQPEKTTDLTAVEDPEEWERRCDIHILTKPGLMLGVSMPKTSYYKFAQYVAMINKQELDVTQVVTEIWVTQRKGPMGVYNILNFKAIQVLKEVQDNEIPF